ncbi:MAG: D-alanine--D-alanine ligase [Pseudomonadota bacterium]
MAKRTVAVFFGGRSPEHDVSIVTALQVMSALDADSYDVLPVYLATNGSWWTGDILRERSTYLPSAAEFDKLTQVTLDMTASGRPGLVAQQSGLFRKAQRFDFDVALPSFHGLIGEDGQIQGTFEAAGVPYTGMRTMASAILMDKVATKRMLAGTDVDILPYREIRRPNEGLMVTPGELEEILGDFPGPWCVKPSHLGSSIGVARAETLQEISDVLPAIFKFDTSAILEPFVENMIEYNIAVSKYGASKDGGNVGTSAIERPKRSSELLDFKEKYLSGGGSKKTGSKTPGQSSEGMLSLTRELNPQLPQGLENKIREMAVTAFDAVGGTGAPRIDFIGNEVTGEIWLNEVNPCPGSFGYFLWEAMTGSSVLFTDLLDGLIREALDEAARARIPADPTPTDARLFSRRG